VSRHTRRASLCCSVLHCASFASYAPVPMHFSTLELVDAGVLLWEMMTGVRAWAGMSHTQVRVSSSIRMMRGPLHFGSVTPARLLAGCWCSCYPDAFTSPCMALHTLHGTARGCALATRPALEVLCALNRLVAHHRSLRQLRWRAKSCPSCAAATPASWCAFLPAHTPLPASLLRDFYSTFRQRSGSWTRTLACRAPLSVKRRMAAGISGVNLPKKRFASYQVTAATYSHQTACLRSWRTGAWRGIRRAGPRSRTSRTRWTKLTRSCERRPILPPEKRQARRRAPRL